MHNTKKCKSTILILGILLLLITLIAFSYAMYKADIININKTETSVNTKKMGLIYTGGTDVSGRTEINETGIVPGQSFSKTFTVENITDSATWYNIYMENITNDYGEDLVYTLYETDENYENIIRTVTTERKLPGTTNGKKYLKTRIDIEAEPKVQYFKMVVEYKELPDVAQHYNKEDEFEGTVGIDQNTEAEEDIPDIDPDNDYTITINPNGGLYEESLDVHTEIRRGGETYNVSLPTRVGHTFDGWEVSDSYSYKNNVVTIYSNDVTLKAKWRLTDDTIAVAQIVRTGTKYARIQDAENEAIDNDTIKILKDTSEIFVNSKIVTIDFDDHTVTGQLNNTGNITLINGTLENENDYTINNTGTLTLGVKDNNVDIDDIAIKTDVDHNTIKQDGTMNFYDGYVEGYVAIVGSVDDVPDPVEENGVLKRYYVYVEHKEENDKAWQKAYVVKEPNAVAKRIDGTEIFYYNLQDAINSSEEAGKTIYAITEFTASYDLEIHNTSKHDIVFDLDGYNVFTGSTIINNKTLTLTNNKTTGVLMPSKSITNTGTLLVKDISITMQQDQNAVNNTSSLSVENSTITARSAYAVSNTGLGVLSFDNDTYLRSNTYGLYTKTTNSYTIENGNIYGIRVDSPTILGSTMVYNSGSNPAVYNTSNLTVEGATISSTAVGINTASTLVINDTTINTTGYAIYSTSTTTINGGTFTSQNNAMDVNGGTVNVYGGDIRGIHVEYTGVLNLRGGNITNYNNNASIEAKGGCAYTKTINIYDGLIESTKVGIQGQSCAKFTMSGGTIVAGTNGIVNNNNGSSVISGGNITGGTNGVYSTTGLTIGNNSNALDITNPTIQGEQYGLYIAGGTTNFYDGILKGQTAGYIGTINAIADATLIESDEVDGYKRNYLKEQDNFLRIRFSEEDIREYNSLNKAVAAIETTGTIEMIDNSIVQKSGATIPSGKNITFDLNGYTYNTEQTITNNGILNLIDSSNPKIGKFYTNKGINLLTNAGTMTVGEVKIESSGTGIRNNSRLTIDGATIDGTSYGLHNTSSATIESGTIRSNGSYSIDSTGGTTTINGGEIRGVYLEGPTTVTINGGHITNNGSAAINASGACAQNKTIYIKGGLIESTSEGVGAGSGCVYLTMSGGKIDAGTNGINNSSTRYSYTITGGEIIGGTNGVYTTKNLTIGNNSNAVDITDPMIQGEQYGLYIAGGTINIYDGMLKGQTAGYTGTINAIADATLIESDEVDGYKRNYLKEQENFLRVTFPDESTHDYNSLNKAVAAIETTGTIEMIAAPITQKSGATIPSGKNITFDLNGYIYDTEQTITNNGTLNLIDSSNSKTGKFYTNKGINLLTNAGTMTVGEVKIESSGTGIRNNSRLTIDGATIDGASSGLYNTSSATIESGTIRSNGVNGVDSTGGTTTINGGEIRGVYLEGPATVTINGGHVTNNGSSAAINASGACAQNKTLYIKGGLIESTGEGVGAGSTCVYLTMSGGKIDAGTTGINNSATRYSYTITGGEIIGGTYGVYSTKTLTIGNNSNALDITDPIIQGEQYGLYIDGGTINFYDGTLRGKTGGFYGTFRDITANTEITYEEQEITPGEVYNANYLSVETDIVTDGTDIYTNIQTAIDSVSDGATLTLLRNASIYYSITLNKNITFDMNGYNLFLASPMTNSANTTIYSSTAKSRLNTIYGINILTNTGTLDISNIEFRNTSTENYIFTNSGTSIIDNVSVTSINGINNTSNGILTLTNSLINASRTAINNGGKIVIDSGTYNGTTQGIYDSSIQSNSINNVTTTGIYTAGNATKSITNSTITSLLQNSSTITSQGNTINNSLRNYGTFDDSSSVINASITNEGQITTTNSILNSYITNSGIITLNNSDNIRNEKITHAYEVLSFISNTGTINMNNSKLAITNPYNERPIYAFNNSTDGVFNCNSCEIELKGVQTLIGLRSSSSSSVSNIDDIIIDVSGNNNNTVYGVYSGAGTTTITSGNIAASNGINAYGAYLDGGILTLGEAESTSSPDYGQSTAHVSTTSPKIQAVGTTTGIGIKNVNGSFDFYDGSVIGSSASIPDTITHTEYLYDTPYRIYGNEEINGDGYFVSYLIYRPNS